jgi:hypothetical protein
MKDQQEEEEEEEEERPSGKTCLNKLLLTQ